MMQMNLQGIRVLELAHWISGPLAGQILGEWGADVIKVERPGTGDITRSNFPKFKDESLYYRTFNRDKKSITLDTTSPEGREAFFQLIEQSDVLLTNFTTSFLEKVGITYETVRERNPKIVACFITGFGRTGKYKDKKALDMVMQAMSGLMSVTGEEGGRPLKVGTVIGDYIGAYQAVIGCLIGLLGRSIHGEGQMVDLGITDCLISGLEWRFTEQLLTGATSGKTGNRRANSGPSNLYEAQDGYVYIAANGQNLYDRLCEGIGDPELLDPMFANNDLRTRNYRALDEIIQRWVASMNQDEICGRLNQMGIPNGPVLSVQDLLKDSYLKDREMIVEVDDPVIGKLPLMQSPIKMSGGYRREHIAPPILGADNRAVYGGLLGWDEEKLENMRQKKII